MGIFQKMVMGARREVARRAEQGIVSWEAVALSCLRYMSEDDVRDMGESEGFIESDEE